MQNAIFARSDPFEVKSGLKQEDALSPILFNLALEKIIRGMRRSKVRDM